MNNRLAVAFSTALVFTMTFTAAAQTDSADFRIGSDSSTTPPSPLFAEVDVNQDGQISKQEARVHPDLEQVFDQTDVNGDGQLSAEEYQGMVHQPRG
ncbi:MAG: EF-hand domain-containing protein [Gammaproteobacteria bacterium]|nr:EF-hand domain-containing protein [Gammaproteobacteria bacterium]